MPGTLVPQGPWPGGMALDTFTRSPYSAPPGSLRYVNNLDITDQGSLQPRPGIRKCGITAMYTNTRSFELLGTLDGRSDIDAASSIAIIGVTRNTSQTDVYYTVAPHSTAGANWPNVPGGPITGSFSTVVQYNNVVYFVPIEGGTGNGQSRTTMTVGAYTSVPAIPGGRFASVVRERMFVFNQLTNRMYWSKATDPTIWAAPDGGFTDINPGDGQFINSVVVVNSQIYIFKAKKTYLFTFTSDPAIDGQVTLISGAEGAFAATTYNNVIYAVNRKSVYRLQNTVTTPLATAQNFELNLLLGLSSFTSINVEGNYLVVGPFFPSSGQAYSHAAMNLNTGAWSLRSYQAALGTFPTQFLDYMAPSGYAINWRDGSTSLPTAAYGGTGNLYANGATLLYSRTIFPVLGDSLDYDLTGHQVSPQYDVITQPFSSGQYDAWKRLHHLYAHLTNSLAVGDNPITLSTYPSPALTAAQTVNVPTAGGKVPIRSYRFRATSFGLSKALKDLGAGLDPRVPTNSSNLYVYDLEPHISSNGRVVNTS